MIPSQKVIKVENLANELKAWMSDGGRRIGLLTSVDGNQLIVLVLNTTDGSCQIWQSPLEADSYKSLTLSLPQLHWFERELADMFGIQPEGHPRLKPLLLNESYPGNLFPFALTEKKFERSTDFQFMEVTGEGVYEIPVGPIHAGIIEPGHFRFSCFGETIVNLEIKLGYVHRGVEKKITQVPVDKARFVAEAAASDTAIGNSLAFALALESIGEVAVPPLAQSLRTLALEIERVAMHIGDIGGIGTDMGFLPISSGMGRLRGQALTLAEMLTGNRFMRGFILPGGVRYFRAAEIKEMKSNLERLHKELKPLITFLQDNQVAKERMSGIGQISKSMAQAFGIVGVAARASGIAYDTRKCFHQGLYPMDFPLPREFAGDVLARTATRIFEIESSVKIMEHVLDNLPAGSFQTNFTGSLPADGIGVGIVEAFRGELIYLVITDSQGCIKRCAIKDPSINNWTALSISIRNNLISDFPLCNKSFSLSYSGNDR